MYSIPFPGKLFRKKNIVEVDLMLDVFIFNSNSPKGLGVHPPVPYICPCSGT